jgi:hypothetical protein
MKKINTVVITRRTTPPTSIRKCLETAPLLSPQFVESALSRADVARILSKEKPSIVMIDGEYGTDDRNLWTAMNLMGRSSLRLYLLDSNSRLPASLRALKLINAMKEDSTTVVIFLDGASEVLKAEIMKIGAFVWPSLNRLSKLESSFYQTVLGAKTLGTGVAAMVKSLYDSFIK